MDNSCSAWSGSPVGPLAEAAQKPGAALYRHGTSRPRPMRHGAVGYLTGRPGSCIAVTGPGVIHGLAGLANAQQNCWPMLLIGGASETYRNGMGAFQEERQVLAATPVSKWAHAYRAPPTASRLYVEMAVAPIDLRPPRFGLSRHRRRHHHRRLRRRQGAFAPRNARIRCASQTMPQYVEQALDVLQSARSARW